MSLTLGHCRARALATRTLGWRVTGGRRLFSSDSENDSQSFDTIVIGGGVVGSALACGLATSPMLKGCKIGIVENMAPKPFEEVVNMELPDLRVFAISPSNIDFFKRIGVWEGRIGRRVHAFRDMKVWDGTGNGSMHFDASDLGDNNEMLGYIIENRVLQCALFDRVQELKDEGKLEVFCPGTLKSMKLNGTTGDGFNSWAQLVLGCGADGAEEKQVAAQLVVAADGAMSKTRQSASIGTWGWDYDQRAVVATIKTSAPHTTAWQRFLKTGPIAILPLSDNYSSIVWSTSPSHAQQLCNMPPEDFTRELNHSLNKPASAAFAPPPVIPPFFGAAATAVNILTQSLTSAQQVWHTKDGPLTGSSSQVQPPLATECVGPRGSFPLKFSQAQRYACPRVALVGDAAHTVHPMAGQGLNLGLGDADELVKVLARGAATGQDFGAMELLQDYEAERKRANLVMASGLDAIKRIFSTDSLPQSLLRNTGMSIIDAGLAKSQIARYAMGR